MSVSVRVARIDQGSHRPVRKPLFPTSRGQIHDITGRVQTDALQHVHQVGVGIHSVQFARADQALDDPKVFRPQFCPAEHPVFLAHWDGT